MLSTPGLSETATSPLSPANDPSVLSYPHPPPVSNSSSLFTPLFFSQSITNESLRPYGLQQSFTLSRNLLKLMSIESVMPSNHLILCLPLLLLPSNFSSIRVFSNESALPIRWPECWSFSFTISPSNEYSVLISFRIDLFDLAVHRTLKSLIQHHSLKASILWHSTL